jgi:SAM-dependent methyltransferase
MPSEHEIETYLREAPPWTSRALARAGTYELVADATAPGRVLELGCGDGHLLAMLRVRGCEAIGIDLRGAALRGPGVACARAQELPFADAVFDAVVSHLVLPVIPRLDDVIAESARVLRDGGRFVALVGGGPRAVPETEDAFAWLAARAAGRAPRMTDPRLRSTRGIAALLERWHDVEQTDHDIELSGRFDDVWPFLAAQYGGATATDEAALRAQFPHERVPCSMHARLVTATLRR